MKAADSTSAAWPRQPPCPAAASRWMTSNSLSRFSSFKVFESAKPLQTDEGEKEGRAYSSDAQREQGSANVGISEGNKRQQAEGWPGWRTFSSGRRRGSGAQTPQHTPLRVGECVGEQEVIGMQADRAAAGLQAGHSGLLLEQGGGGQSRHNPLSACQQHSLGPSTGPRPASSAPKYKA